MKPFLFLAALCGLVMAACHKKADTLHLSDTWKFVRYESYGPSPLTYGPGDSTILLGFASNRYSIEKPYQQPVQGHYTIDRVNSVDSILRLDVSPMLFADSNLRIPQEEQVRIIQSHYGDSLVISSYPIYPSGTAKFIFVKFQPPQPQN